MQTAPEYRVGTASWTDPTLLATDFYPAGCTSAEARLRYYVSRFDTVEVDSTYYAVPSERNAMLWAQRSPAGFVFNVKAFAWLTQHAAEARALPRVIRDHLSSDQLRQGRLRAPSTDAWTLAAEMFAAALAPLRPAGKLGCLLFQFPPWFTATDAHRAYILTCRAAFPGDQLAVEFRHTSWFRDEARGTLQFLEEHGLHFVSIDAPRLQSVPPPILRATGDIAYVRFHGRNQRAWFRTAGSAAERYKYAYETGELREWARRISELQGVRTVYVLFNNCYADYGVRNATEMRALLAAR